MDVLLNTDIHTTSKHMKLVENRPNRHGETNKENQSRRDKYLMMKETTKRKTLLKIQKSALFLKRLCSERKLQGADHLSVYCGAPCSVKQELEK